jgi:hypothetical protein
VRPAPGERFDLKFWVNNAGFGLFAAFLRDSGGFEIW